MFCWEKKKNVLSLIELRSIKIEIECEKRGRSTVRHKIRKRAEQNMMTYDHCTRWCIHACLWLWLWLWPEPASALQPCQLFSIIAKFNWQLFFVCWALFSGIRSATAIVCCSLLVAHYLLFIMYQVCISYDSSKFQIT